MGGAKGLRRALIAGGALAATAFAAAAQESPVLGGAPETSSNQVNFSDPNAPIEGAALNLSVRDDANTRFSALGNPRPPNTEGPHRVELSLAAGGEESPVDVSISQRASLGADHNGDLDRQGRGSELRVGRGLVDERDDGPRDATYVFLASDNEALTWQPGTRNEFGGHGGSFSMQDQVEVGDLSAGVTWERGGVQTSLAYVEREQSTRVGNQTYSHDENFAGVTVTMRH